MSKIDFWMHGLGKQPEEAARRLKKLGFSTVVGTVSQAEAAMSVGLNAYLCSGAYRGPDFKGEEWLAEDTKGHKQEWFYSTCPTREEVREYNLEQIGKMAQTPGIQGILIDGARFASPSSNDTPECFYTCFCSSCQAKMRSYGLSPYKLQQAVDTLYEVLHGSAMVLMPYKEGLEEWMQFRRLATTEHLTNFTKVVRNVNPDLKCGIYIFAPAFSYLVGQSYADVDRIMDLTAPMLYRAYSDVHGASCLNAEAGAIMTMLEGNPHLSEENRIFLLRLLTGISLDQLETPIKLGEPLAAQIQKGFQPTILKTETGRAKQMLSQSRLVPIIQLDDPELPASIQETLDGGTEAVNFFVYDEAELLKQETYFDNKSRE